MQSTCSGSDVPIADYGKDVWSKEPPGFLFCLENKSSIRTSLPDVQSYALLLLQVAQIQPEIQKEHSFAFDCVCSGLEYYRSATMILQVTHIQPDIQNEKIFGPCWD